MTLFLSLSLRFSLIVSWGELIQFAMSEWDVFLLYPVGLVIRQILFSLVCCSCLVEECQGEFTTCLNKNEMISYFFSELILSSYIKKEVNCNFVNILISLSFICFVFQLQNLINYFQRSIFCRSSEHFYLIFLF